MGKEFISLRGERTYPFIPVHIPQSHGDVVRTISEGAIWIGLGCVNVPIGTWWCCWPLEIHRFPD